MNLVTVSGPPSSGKTAIILKTAATLMQKGVKVGVVKFDCLSTDDDLLYEKAGIPVRKGISGALCPDHYFVSNIEETFSRAIDSGCTQIQAITYLPDHGMSNAMFKDCFGYIWLLHEIHREANLP